MDSDGRVEPVRLHATDDLRAVGTVEVALILTKSAKTADAAQGAAQVLAPEGLAITLQNGLGNLEIIAHHVGAERATLGVTTQGASTRGEPGALYHGGAGLTYLATRPEIEEQVHTVAALFQQAGLPTEVVDDVTALMWGKLAVNAAINPLSALLRVPNGALTGSEWTRRLMRKAAQEVAAVAAAQGIALPFDDPAAQAEKVAGMTAYNRSSMLQDVLRGTETEIEVICGAVTRLGEALGVETPVNRTLYHLVKALETLYSVRIEKMEQDYPQWRL